MTDCLKTIDDFQPPVLRCFSFDPTAAVYTEGAKSQTSDSHGAVRTADDASLEMRGDSQVTLSMPMAPTISGSKSASSQAASSSKVSPDCDSAMTKSDACDERKTDENSTVTPKHRSSKSSRKLVPMEKIVTQLLHDAKLCKMYEVESKIASSASSMPAGEGRELISAREEMNAAEALAHATPLVAYTNRGRGGRASRAMLSRSIHRHDPSKRKQLPTQEQAVESVLSTLSLRSIEARNYSSLTWNLGIDVLERKREEIHNKSQAWLKCFHDRTEAGTRTV
jgi:hypothetical protein